MNLIKHLKENLTDKFIDFQRNLERPILFFDLETTGVNTNKDRIVEMTLVKVTQNKICDPKVMRFNPEISIPIESTNIHGISNEDIKDCPTFSSKAQQLYTLFDQCDYSGFNISRFDIPMLEKEFERSELEKTKLNGKIVDVFELFKNNVGRTLSSAYKYYKKEDLKNAHSSLADILATMEIFDQQLNEHKLPSDVVQIIEENSKKKEKEKKIHFLMKDEKWHFAFGKHDGKPIDDPELKDYLTWMLTVKPPKEFPEDTKKIIIEHLESISIS